MTCRISHKALMRSVGRSSPGRRGVVVGVLAALLFVLAPQSGHAQVEVEDDLMRTYAHRKRDRLEYWILTTTHKIEKWTDAMNRLNYFLSDVGRISSLAEAVRNVMSGGFGYANPHAGALLEKYFPALDSAITDRALLYRQAQALRSTYARMLEGTRRQLADLAAAQAHLDDLAEQLKDVESQQAAFDLMNTVRQVRTEQLWLYRQLVHLRINARVLQASYETYRKALKRRALRCALESCEGGSAAPVY